MEPAGRRSEWREDKGSDSILSFSGLQRWSQTPLCLWDSAGSLHRQPRIRATVGSRQAFSSSR